MLTLARINKELEARGHAERLTRGRGYFYFIGGLSDSFYDQSVMVNALNQLSLDQWITELEWKKEDAA